MHVAIRELKDRLSDYLRRAEAGEEIVVTSHGRQIVRIVPIQPAASESEALERLHRELGVRPGSGARPQGARSPIPSPASGPSLTDLMLDARQ